MDNMTKPYTLAERVTLAAALVLLVPIAGFLAAREALRSEAAIVAWQIARALFFALAGTLAALLACGFAVVERFDLAGGALVACGACCWLFAWECDR